MWGISLEYIEEKFGKKFKLHFLNKSKKFVDSDLIVYDESHFKTTQKGKFLSDGIASELFLINLWTDFWNDNEIW